MDLTVSGESAGVFAPAEPDSAVDQVLDDAAEELLSFRGLEGDDPGYISAPFLADIADVVHALEVTGNLPAPCAGLDRLVTLPRLLRLDVLPVLAARAQPAELPETWTSVLETRGRRDSPCGDAAAAGVLPELDGQRWLIAGLHCDAGETELQVMGWGTDRAVGSLGRDWQEPSFWWARDDAGRWHMCRRNGGSYGGGHSQMNLQVTPPLDPAATALDITVRGRSGRSTVTIPLRWMKPQDQGSRSSGGRVNGTSPTGKPDVIASRIRRNMRSR
ncbi:MAG: hypothetical protein ACLPUO_05855 [Streptosporangiaceae bacterium]